MSEPTYIVIVTGHEGIDRLVWAGTDIEEAVRRVRATRALIGRVSARHEKLRVTVDKLIAAVDPAFPGGSTCRWHEAQRKMWRTLETEFGEDWSDLAYSTPDHVCVQVYEPATDKVRCCCVELGVGASKPMFR